MPVRTLTTVEDVLALPDRDDVRYEIDEGELIELTLPRPLHNVVASRIYYALETYTRSTGSGLALTSDAPFVLSRNPDILRAPDAAFIRDASIDLSQLIEGAPNLAVEVASPTDRMKAMLKKVAQYLEAGAEEVWLVLPASREIQVYTPDESPKILTKAKNSVPTSFPASA